MNKINIGTEFISKMSYPFEVENSENESTYVNCGEKCKIIDKSKKEITLLNLALGQKEAWFKISFNDLMKLQGLPIAEDNITYISIWIDETETWHFFKNNFDKNEFTDGYVDYYITVKDGIVISDTYKTSNKGKIFYDIYNINRWEK